MLIPYISHNQQEIARWLPDKLLNKLIPETAQMLSTAHRVLDGEFKYYIEELDRYVIPERIEFFKHVYRMKSFKIKRVYRLPDEREQILYKAYQPNNRFVVWVRKSVNNYYWLLGLYVALYTEYKLRKGKEHKSEQLMSLLLIKPQNLGNSIDTSYFMPPPRLPKMPNTGDLVRDYREYLMSKTYKMTWTKPGIRPEWWLK